MVRLKDFLSAGNGTTCQMGSQPAALPSRQSLSSSFLLLDCLFFGGGAWVEVKFHLDPGTDWDLLLKLEGLLPRLTSERCGVFFSPLNSDNRADFPLSLINN